jgi:serine/alanine adding enzyme
MAYLPYGHRASLCECVGGKIYQRMICSVHSESDYKSKTIWIEQLNKCDRGLWEQFVCRHPHATFAHLPGVSEAFEKAYGLSTVALGAFRAKNRNSGELPDRSEQGPHLVGLLPMVHIKQLFGGSEWVSMPFLDTGGIIAEDQDAGEMLVREALRIASSGKAQKLEFRQNVDGWFRFEDKGADQASRGNSGDIEGYYRNTLRHKVRMVLELPDSAEILMQTFKSKLRSQIRKPIRDGLTVRTGGLELLDHFYEIFSANMRDLGSPVHSKAFFRAVVQSLPQMAHIFVVYRQSTPLAAGIVIGFGDWLFHPWASSLKTYNHLNANMLLYWRMLEFGCRQRFKRFDFGRSTPDEGTFKFKAQWGAVPHSLEWSIFSTSIPEPVEEKKKYAVAINCWRKLPVGLTRWLGPKIRKHISL